MGENINLGRIQEYNNPNEGRTIINSAFEILEKLNFSGLTGVWEKGTGLYSVQTIGTECNAYGNYSTAEGEKTIASGACSHAEGTYTIASGDNSHSEGGETISSGFASHAEGNTTTASGNHSHSEGEQTISRGQDSHAEGSGTKAMGNYSHTEGYNTSAATTASASHAEGRDTITNGDVGHAEGRRTAANGQASHSEGIGSVAYLYGMHAKKSGSAESDDRHYQYGNVTVYSYTENNVKKPILINDSLHITILNNTIFNFKINGLGTSSEGLSANYNITGRAKNIQGTITVDNVSATTICDDFSIIGMSAEADDLNKSLAITATGKAATIIYWTAFVEWVEMTFE